MDKAPKTSGIYCVRNTANNKVYVGSSLNLYNRSCNHVGKLRSGNHNNKELLSDYQIFGKENFVFQVIELCEIEHLAERETYYIKTLKSGNQKFGYNKHKKIKRIPTEDVREKMRNAKLGTTASEETRKKIADIHRGLKMSKENVILLSKRMKGSKMSEESRKKLSESRKGIIISEESKIKNMLNHPRNIVKCYDLEKNFIIEYPSLHAASRISKVARDGIKKCIKGQYKQSGGFIWTH